MAREDAAVEYGGRSTAPPNAAEDALSWGEVKTTGLRAVLEKATEGGRGRSIALPNAAGDGL